MRTPIPLLHRLVTIFESFNAQPRARKAALANDKVAETGAKPRAVNTHTHGFSLTAGRQLVLRGHRVWPHKARTHGDAAQTPSNLM